MLPTAWWFPLIIISLALPLCSCVEEQEPEIFLPPRNFNPHPYQNGYEPRRNGNTGPVLFPPTAPGLGVNGNSGELRTTGELHPIDRHPYATVAKKQRYKLAGRYDLKDNHVNPGVYNGLAAFAEKLLRKPPSALKDYANPSASNNKKNYAFAYKVLDRSTGDDFSHRQSQTPQATKGEYRVKLPDGRLQIVSYTADENGYKADVTYAEDESAVAKVVQPQVAIRNPPEVLQKVNPYDYQQYVGEADVYQQAPQHETPEKVQEPLKAYYPATARPVYYVDNYDRPQEYRQQKVQVFNVGEHGLVSSTLAPYVVDQASYQPVIETVTVVPQRTYTNVYAEPPKVELYTSQRTPVRQQLYYKK